MTASRTLAATLIVLSGTLAGSAMAQSTFTSRSLTVETALKAAQAALETCRKNGFQVGVAIADRAGVPQVFLRDRFAGPHTVEMAANKAWTAASFLNSNRAGRSASSFVRRTQSLSSSNARLFVTV